MNVEIQMHTLDDGERLPCLFFDSDSGMLPLPAEHAVLFAALLDENIDAYEQLYELARTLLGMTYADAVEA